MKEIEVCSSSNHYLGALLDKKPTFYRIAKAFCVESAKYP